MNKRAHKVAILHHDKQIVARVTLLATAAGLDCVAALSLSGLARQAPDPLLSAIVAAPAGDIAALDRLRSAYPRTAIIILADGAVAPALEAAAKKIDVAICLAPALNDAELTRLICGGRDRPPSFGPAQIANCIKDGHFSVEYQPKVSLLSAPGASQFGVEALCRMRDPHFGPIAPDRFIPMAEGSGLIADLTDAVTCEAFRAWGAWKRAGLTLRLALNVSPLLLGNSEWSERLLQACAKFEVEPRFITLEITESAAGATDPRPIEILTQLQRKGFALSIDDFGTGFSSLATLYRLPIAEMKIDKSFIFDLQTKAGARHLVESAIAMATRMGIKVVAEGVETESVFEELRRMGCHEVQGYFVGKSMPADAIPGFFTAWRGKGPGAHLAAGLPKIAILQALLNEIVSDRSLETNMAARGPYGSQATPQAGSSPKDLVRKLPPIILEGKTLPALALCHDIVRHLQGFPACNDMRAKVSQLQSHLERELLTVADLELRSSQGTFRLLPRSSVTLGRPCATGSVDIPVQCRWLSSGERNLRVFAQNGQWYVEDLGSAHGYLVQDRRLAPGRPVELALGETAVEVRLASGAVAPLSLILRRRALDPDAVTITFDYDAQSLRADLGEKDWSVLESDLECSWIVFGGKLSVGSLPDCALRLRECATPIAASISFDGGYWISPGPKIRLAIDGTAFSRATPLTADAALTIDEGRLAVQAIPVRGAAKIASAPAEAKRRA